MPLTRSAQWFSGLFTFAVVCSVCSATPLYLVGGIGYENSIQRYVLNGSSSSAVSDEDFLKIIVGDAVSTVLYSFAMAGPGALAAESLAGGPAAGLSGSTSLYASGAARLREYFVPENGQTDGFIRLLFEVHTVPPLTGMTLGPLSPGFAAIGVQLYETPLSQFPDQYLVRSSFFLSTDRNGNPVFQANEKTPRTFIDIPILPDGRGIVDVTLFVDAQCNPAGVLCIAHADWAHTVRFGGAIVFDAQGNPEPGVQVIGESGFKYSDAITTAAPEPATFLMFAIGTGLLLSRLLFRRCLI